MFEPQPCARFASSLGSKHAATSVRYRHPAAEL